MFAIEYFPTFVNMFHLNSLYFLEHFTPCNRDERSFSMGMIQAAHRVLNNSPIPHDQVVAARFYEATEVLADVHDDADRFLIFF